MRDFSEIASLNTAATKTNGQLGEDSSAAVADLVRTLCTQACYTWALPQSCCVLHSKSKALLAGCRSSLSQVSHDQALVETDLNLHPRRILGHARTPLYIRYVYSVYILWPQYMSCAHTTCPTVTSQQPNWLPSLKLISNIYIYIYI